MLKLTSFGVAIAACTACRAHESALDPVDSTGGNAGVAGVASVAHIIDLEDPESVRYDPDQDVYFISNMLGYGSAKDGVGYIARAQAGDPSKVDVFIESGRNGVTLNAPKGMAIVGDTLYTMGAREDQEFLIAVDVIRVAEKWSVPAPCLRMLREPGAKTGAATVGTTYT